MSEVDESGSNRRKFPRVKAPVLYRPARFRSTRTPVVDIGLGGMRVYSDEPFKVGDRLNIELFLPTEQTIECLVGVVWVKELPASSPAKFDVGLQLLDAGAEDLRLLAKILDDDA